MKLTDHDKKILKESIEGAITEIRAGSSLFPLDDTQKAWNEANERAIRILSRYAEGKGLFQL